MILSYIDGTVMYVLFMSQTFIVQVFMWVSCTCICFSVANLHKMHFNLKHFCPYANRTLPKLEVFGSGSGNTWKLAAAGEFLHMCTFASYKAKMPNAHMFTRGEIVMLWDGYSCQDYWMYIYFSPSHRMGILVYKCRMGWVFKSYVTEY